MVHSYGCMCVLPPSTLIRETFAILLNRSTFRRISQDTGKFVRFANGLMNESNSLVAAVMEKLPEVRAVQLQMRDPAQWGAMTETQRNEVSERYVMQRVRSRPM